MEILLEYFLEYRYLVIFLGTFIEGEVILVAGGLLAYEGHLSFPTLIAISTVAAVLWDTLFYAMGRERRGSNPSRTSRLLQFIGDHRLFKGEEFVRRHGGKSVFLMRFFYGLRFAGAMSAGLFGMTFGRFVFFNVLGSFTWAVAMGSLGYLFGHSIMALTHSLRLAELGAVLFLAGLVIIYFLNLRRRRKTTNELSTDAQR